VPTFSKRLANIVSAQLPSRDISGSVLSCDPNLSPSWNTLFSSLFETRLKSHSELSERLLRTVSKFNTDLRRTPSVCAVSKLTCNLFCSVFFKWSDGSAYNASSFESSHIYDMYVSISLRVSPRSSSFVRVSASYIVLVMLILFRTQSLSKSSSFVHR